MADGGERPGGDPALERRLLAANPDGWWLFGDDAVTIWANGRMAEILGRDPAEMVGLHVHDTLDEQGRRDFDRALAGMVDSGAGGQDVDCYFVRPDGTTVWGLISFTPLLDDDGSRIGWLHRVTPHTERKALLETLVEREQQLATAQRIAHLGSWEWEIGSDRVGWSDELCRIFGVEPGSEVTYATYIDRLHPADRPIARAKVQAALASGSEYTFDHRVVRPDGSVRWVRGRGLVERGPDGAAIRMSGTAQDITEMRGADEQARQAARRLRLLQQMAIAANRAATLREALLVAGAGVPEHTSWVPLTAYLYDAAGGPEALPLGEGPVPPDPALAEQARATGEVVLGIPPALADTHRLVAMPVFLDAEVACVVELLADEVAPDEESHRVMAQVAHQLGVVAERERSAAQLAEARDDAMEASRLKSEFLATMSHEIRTPMNGVIGLTDLLLRTGLDEHQRRLAENLQNAGMTLLGIINDILDLSKIESGKLELEAGDVEVRAVFEQVAAVLSGPAHEKGLELVLSCHADVPTHLRGDPVRFGQVISNLGSNAVKFTDTGEVLIEARVERETAREVVLRVDVTDTGVGIEPGSRERLFEAFTQADPSTTRRHGGTGLGLAISRQLVDALGGELWVTSEPGSGSTFSFTARFGRVADPAEAEPEELDQLRGRRILVVDDNETNRMILEDQLAAWEMAAVSAPTARVALRTLREAADAGTAYEVVLLDLRMPGLDGLDLAREIHSDPSIPDAHLLLLSSESVPRQLVADAGISGNLSKPVRPHELRSALVGLLAPRLRAVAPPEEVEPPALGFRVLVVEDNPVNQLVATGLLESLGCSVEVADDGQEAVELLAGRHLYDAVLMDCRMPRLDGFDATRLIREQEAPGRRVPIIAMTASALEGERDRCLEAGMDDYLTKPVDVVELAHALRTWTDPAATARGQESPPRTSGILDLDRVRMLDALIKDGTSFFERTAAAFMGRVGDQVVTLRAAVDDRNPKGLAAAAHQLKGSALNLGLPRVAQVAAELEVLGLQGGTDGADRLLDRLAAEVEIAVSALQRATAEGL